jgi:hypothetical protein
LIEAHAQTDLVHATTVIDNERVRVWFNRGDRVHFETLVKGRQSAIMVELKWGWANESE